MSHQQTRAAARLNARPRTSIYDLRPIAHLVGWHIGVFGITMLLPWILDLSDGNPNARGFLISAFLTISAGLALVVVSRESETHGLTAPQAFLLTIVVWTALPALGGLPFMFGAPGVGFADAFFEAMSGMTTTGSTVFSGLDAAPRGMLLWRAMLQWFGGIGIVIVAIVFLPAMRIGGMQFFRAVSFDVSGDIIPQATRIAADLVAVYLTLTVCFMLTYAALGMSVFDAICHAMTTVSTGGYANYDASFGAFGPSLQYAAIVFMLLSAMPFIRFVSLMKGTAAPLVLDSQVRTFLIVVLVVSAILASWRIETSGDSVEAAIRASLFNLTSVITTTGYATTDYSAWGGFAGVVFFVIALVGGCSASTTGAAKIFRFQILFKALVVEVRRLHSPNGVFPLRYQGRKVEPEIVSSIMAFFFFYVVLLSATTILMSLMGLDHVTAMTASIATVTNVGPGLGPVIGPAGNFSSLPDAAKWVLSFVMLLGRLEFLSVLVLFTPLFWRR